MHSWVFRHRARLRVIYGPPPIVDDELVEPPASAPRDESGGARRMRMRKNRPAPGTLARRGRWVLVAPMPRREA